MAHLGDGIFARMIGDAELSTAVERRVYPRVRPQNTGLPAIVYTLMGGNRDEHLKGYNGTRRPRVQLDCYAKTWAQAQALAERAVILFAQPATAAGIVFGHSKADEPRDLGEDTGVGKDPGGGFINRASVDLLVEYRLA